VTGWLKIIELVSYITQEDVRVKCVMLVEENAVTQWNTLALLKIDFHCMKAQQR
jgi:hypothetical protein